jgi:hypothetical protein
MNIEVLKNRWKKRKEDYEQWRDKTIEETECLIMDALIEKALCGESRQLDLDLIKEKVRSTFGAEIEKFSSEIKLFGLKNGNMNSCDNVDNLVNHAAGNLDQENLVILDSGCVSLITQKVTELINEIRTNQS